MPIITAAVIGGGLGLLGSSMQADSNEAAAATAASGNAEAARIAAAESRFRPVGITTRFGSSGFDYGIPGVTAPVAKDFKTPEEFAAAQTAYQTRLANEGRVTGARYTLDPGLKAIQDRLLKLTESGLLTAEQAEAEFGALTTGARGLFSTGQNYLTKPADARLGGFATEQFKPSAGATALSKLGEQYVAQSPQEAAAQYMALQQNLLAPSRERQLAGLQNELFQTGRGGLAVGATGTRPGGGAGLGAASPEMEAYYNAIAQQDALLASQATKGGMDRTEFGGRLLTGGEALQKGRISFGADLLGLQEEMEQGRTRFGAGLVATGGNLLTQGYGGRVSAMSPYQTFLSGATSLEALGQDPLNIGSTLGGRVANPTGASFLFSGNRPSAESYAANAFNPFAESLTSASRNPQLQQGLQNLFNRRAPNYFDSMGNEFSGSGAPIYDY